MVLKKNLFSKNFVLLFQGMFVSQIGTSSMLLIMVLWLKEATESAIVVSSFFMASVLPMIFLSPLGGAIADYFSRKKIIILSDLVNGAIGFFIAALVFMFPHSIEFITTVFFGAAVVFGVVNTVFKPAVFAMVPDIVPSQKLSAANGLIQNTIMVSTMIGQGIGGILFVTIYTPLLFLINSTAYICSAVSEFFIELPKKSNRKANNPELVTRRIYIDILEGFNYIKRKKGLLKIFFAISVVNFFLTPSVVLLPFLVDMQLNAKADWYGYLMAGFAFGMSIGNVIPGIVGIDENHRVRVVVVCYSLLAMAIITLGSCTSPMIAVLLLMVAGLCSGVSGLLIITVVQIVTPHRIRGRVFGLMITCTQALPLVAVAIYAIAAEFLGKNIGLIYWMNGFSILLIPMPILILSKKSHQIMRVIQK